MVRSRFPLFAALLSLLGGGAAAEAAHIRAGLEAETLRPGAGSRITLALSMIPEREWHGYWQNPGDAGAAAYVAWTLPPGMSAGPLRYPVPRRFLTQGLMNYVYERPYALLTTLTVPRGLAPGTKLRIAGKARWLACSSTLCVPEQGSVAIDLVIGDGKVTASSRARFDAWRARLPVPLGRAARFEQVKDRLRIAIPWSSGRPLTDPYFYPATDRVIDYAAPQFISRRGHWLIVEARASANASSVAAIDGVIAIGPDRGFSLTGRPGRVPNP